MTRREVREMGAEGQAKKGLFQAPLLRRTARLAGTSLKALANVELSSKP